MKILTETYYFKPRKELSFLNCLFLLQRGTDLRLAVYNRKILPFVAPINCYRLLDDLKSDSNSRWNPLDHFTDIPLICFVMKLIAEKRPYTVAAAVELLSVHVETEEPLDLFLNLDSIFRLFYYSPSEEGILNFKLFRRYKVTNLLLTTALPILPKKQRRIFSGKYLEDKTTFKKRKKEIAKHRILGIGAPKTTPSVLDYYIPVDLGYLPFRVKPFSLVQKTPYEKCFGAYGRAR
jgi:hypothetical protein